MDWKKELYPENEKPLDRLVEGYSNTSIFRTIGFIGDSLSSGEFEVRNEKGKFYHDLFEYSWGQHIARQNGLKAYNFSRGGMYAKLYMESFAESMGYFDKDKACQAYVIALGVNDLLTFRMEPGSISDIDPEDYRNNKPTYLGYLAQVISKYKEISPDAKFFLVTFPDCETPGRKEEATLDNVKVMSELAEYFDNTYLLNMYEYGPKFNEEFQQKYYLHGHLNPMGYLLQAKLVDSYIDYIIRHNPDDFRNAGFIGTDIDYK